MRIELAPQQGDRNAEICPKLNPEDTPRGKWIKALLKIKGGRAGITLTTQAIRRPNAPDNQDADQGPTTGATKTTHCEGTEPCKYRNVPTGPTPQTPQKKTAQDAAEAATRHKRTKNQDKLHKMDYIQAPARTTRARKRTTKAGTIRPRTTRQTEGNKQRQAAEQQEQTPLGNTHQEHATLRGPNNSMGRPTWRSRGSLSRRRQERNTPTKNRASRSDSQGESDRRR